MLSCGNPQAGAAGYVAIEAVRGRLGDRRGGFAFQQLGVMRGGSPALHYQVVLGSGDGELEGLSETFHFTVEDDGAHRYELEYDPCATARPRDRATSRPADGHNSGAVSERKC